MKKLLCVGLTLILLSGYTIPIVQAETLESELAIQEEQITEALEEENLELVESEFNPEKETYEIQAENENGELVTLELELGATEIAAEVESVDGELENYHISFDENAYIDESSVDEEPLEIEIIELSTGEVFEAEELEGELSAVAIPLGIPIVWSALLALIKACLVVIASGMTFIAAKSVATSILKNKKKKNHYYARIKGGVLYIGPGATEAQALAWLRKGQSTWSTSKNLAKTIVGKIAKGTPINEIDKQNGKPKKGYYWHYHSANRKPKGHHAFYGTAA
ncbi:hypothetical protein GCV60_10560 [Listeria monocytogenes]|nr:hypothetical protein [Listeria monocytogenes]ELC6641717.1 hypothetical protein [Listeria monocytogenes]